MLQLQNQSSLSFLTFKDKREKTSAENLTKNLPTKFQTHLVNPKNTATILCIESCANHIITRYGRSRQIGFGIIHHKLTIDFLSVLPLSNCLWGR